MHAVKALQKNPVVYEGNNFHYELLKSKGTRTSQSTSLYIIQARPIFVTAAEYFIPLELKYMKGKVSNSLFMFSWKLFDGKD